MDLRETFFGTKLRAALTVLGLLVVLVVVLVLLGVLGVPSVQGVENAFGDVNRSTTMIHTDLTINNPNPIGVSLGGVSVDYTVVMNDVPMANGTKQGVSVSSGNSTLAFATAMDNSRIPEWWVSHLRNDETTELRVDATVCSNTVGRCVGTTPVTRPVETDLMGGFNSTETRPVNANAPLVSDPVAYINRTSAHWGDISTATSPIKIAFTVYNPKAVPLTLTTLGYNVSMNGIDMGEGRLEEHTVIPPGESRVVRTTVELQNDRLDEWWVSHLRREQVTTLRLDFYARLDLGATSVRVPLEGLTHEKTIETDMFDNKADDADDDGDTPTTTTSPGSGTETATATPTEPPTTTDDRGLIDPITTTTTETTRTSESTTTTTTTTTTSTSTTTAEETTTTDDGILARDPPGRR